MFTVSYYLTELIFSLPFMLLVKLKDLQLMIINSGRESNKNQNCNRVIML